MGESKRRRAMLGEAYDKPQPGTVASEHTYLRRGGPIPSAYRHRVPSEGGAAIELANDRGITVVGGLLDMTQSEERVARQGPMELGILRNGDALFVVMKINGFATVDMPYDHAAVPKEKRGLPSRLPQQGFLINFIAFDTRTGTIRGLRGISASPDFARRLEEELAQLDARVQASDWRFQSEVQEAYRRWPNPDAMLAAASYREVAGTPFA